MSRFEKCLVYVLAYEGGYVDHPKDPGGATNQGITRKTLAQWRGVSPWWKLPKKEVKNLRKAEVSAIYRNRYWNRCRAALMPVGLDHALFDFAVNSGPSRAVKYLQKVLGSKPDGIIGPKTLKALREKKSSKGTRWIIIELCRRRQGFLRRLAAFSSFGRGWMHRVVNVQRVALEAVVLEPVATEIQIDNNQKRKKPMNFLTGYKTYIVAIIMLLTGLSQMLGIDLPGFEGQASGQLVFESLAVLFLRRGIKNEIASS